MNPAAAFFDTDETVISAKSMFDFLRFRLRRRTGDDRAFDEIHRTFQVEAARGVPRTEINRMYYRLLAGESADVVATEGREWFQQYAGRPDAFVGAVLTAIDRHRSAGDLIVLVSGSFRACLDPITEEVGADLVLCTEPVVDDHGLFTGVVDVPMIGANKALAVRRTLTARGLSVERSTAYGDHSSDLGMLCEVGTGVVVGSDDVLLGEAERRGWPVLPSTGVPRRVRAA